MTKLADAVEHTAARIRANKEDKVAERAEITDIRPMLSVYRGDDQVAILQPESPCGANEMIQCARLAALGFGADVLAVVHEMMQATRKCNPLTNRRWAPGEMQDVAENHDGRAQGWVIDAIMVAAYNRAGDTELQLLPYRIADTAVTWVSPSELVKQEGVIWGDPLADALRHIMTKETTAMQAMNQYGLTALHDGGTTEEALAHMDCATARMFTNNTPAADLLGMPRAHIALAFDHGSRREEIIRASMGDCGYEAE